MDTIACACHPKQQVLICRVRSGWPFALKLWLSDRRNMGGLHHRRPVGHYLELHPLHCSYLWKCWEVELDSRNIHAKTVVVGGYTFRNIDKQLWQVYCGESILYMIAKNHRTLCIMVRITLLLEWHHLTCRYQCACSLDAYLADYTSCNYNMKHAYSLN